MLHVTLLQWDTTCPSLVYCRAAYAVVRCETLVFVTFVYCVETATDTATVAMECE